MRLIVITGTHRSGTSVLARVLNLLGVNLGSNDEMLSPHPQNPKGFWEAKEFVDFHDSLLEHLGSNWHEPPLLSDGWQHRSDIEPFVEEARALLDGKFRGFDHVGFKDPRAASFVPFWQLVEPGARLVLALRNPTEVAGSLAERDGFAKEKSARMWLDTTLSAFRSDHAAAVVTFDQFFDDLEGAVEDLAAALDLSVGDAFEKASSFVDASLRHHERTEDEEVGAELSLALSVYGLVRDRPRNEALPIVDGLFRGRVAERTAAQSEETLQSANDSVVEAQATIDSLKQELARREQHFAAEVSASETRLSDAASKLAASESERRHLVAVHGAKVDELNSDIERLESALTAAQHLEMAAQARALELERSLRLAAVAEADLREEIEVLRGAT